jgi:hypothetical protein
MSEYIELTIHSQDRLHQLRRVDLQRDKAEDEAFGFAVTGTDDGAGNLAVADSGT